MTNKTNTITTQRAYTLRLRGADPQDNSWRDALWATHEAVNKGAKVFGDWLLTLRGGLDHKLADAPIKGGKNKPERDPTPEERRNRRILLALSWLSVESAPQEGAMHGQFVVATGAESKAGRDEKILQCFRNLLRKRGLDGSDIESWISDCEPSLSGAIRDDAVWVNRSDCFDQFAHEYDTLDREYAALTITLFFGPAEEYFALPSISGDDDSDSVSAGSDGPEFRTLARQWVSTNFGTGEKSDTSVIIENLNKLAKASLTTFVGRAKSSLIAEMSKILGGQTDDMTGLRVAVGWKTGRASKGRMAIDNLPDPLTTEAIETMQQKFAEEAEEKRKQSGTRDIPSWMPRFQKYIEDACRLPFKISRDHIGEYSVMLDHAARRVSIGHSWIKRAEAARQKFSSDARKLDDVPHTAKAWLNSFCENRSDSTGALDAYRIRRRAVGGWKEVVARWGRADCQTKDGRIAAAREVQADPEIAKFGDIQLFEALAAEDAKCVWQINGKADPQPLLDYVAATDAIARQKRFKVPAYRHPDALRHPVFCDFGNSRWEIQFAVHQTRLKLDATRRKVQKAQKDLKTSRVKLDKAKTPEQMDKAQNAIKVAEQRLREAEASEAWLSSRHALSMGLWDGHSIRSDLPVRWSSKRLTKDLSLGSHAIKDDTPKPVTRGDRLGRAAASARPHDPVQILNVFDEDHWNGRLQAPRHQLNAIAARVSQYGWDDKAKRMRDSIRWLVTFSTKLQPQGPWMEFAARTQGIRPDPVYWPHADLNKQRGGHARLILSRLPGLRILSVDLGHRFAAACAVWETLSTQAMKKEIGARTIRAGGMSENDLYCHVETPTDRIATSGRNKGKPIPRTTVYRRIGADTLPDGAPHPAPWARLDRQFVIKLPGEDKPARAASNKGECNEVAMVQELANALGVHVDNNGDKSRAVDQLMSQGVQILKEGIRRHARHAKIAYALNPQITSIPGIGGSENSVTFGDPNHIKFFTNALFDWHALASDATSADTFARDLWNEHIASIDSAWRIDTCQSEDSADEPLSREERRKRDEKRKAELERIAAKLTKQNLAAPHQAWKERWHKDDGAPADPETNRKATGFHAHLRLITDWIMGRRIPSAVDNGWRKNVGGLSLTRIATMRSLYQVHKAFAMRPDPDNLRGAPDKGETNTGFAQSILNPMERMREQRVKQLASRITEAALGIGRIKSEHLKAGAARPRAQVDKPCHAVVVEDLTNYRPDELRTRRENRQLMAWSAAKVKKYLSESCQLHGLHLREVQPGYTSRQDSRTGAPGMRCCDVAIDKFKDETLWRRKIKQAQKKVGANKGNTIDQYLIELDNKLTNGAEQNGSGQMRVPTRGGDIFVSTDPSSPAAKGLQADLNAAANIGLRALLDPDWAGKWWYVPCSSTTYEPHPDKVKGSEVFKNCGPLVSRSESDTSTKGSKRNIKEREIVYFWRDPTFEAPQAGKWLGTTAYWEDVARRVTKILNDQQSSANATIESSAMPW